MPEEEYQSEIESLTEATLPLPQKTSTIPPVITANKVYETRGPQPLRQSASPAASVRQPVNRFSLFVGVLFLLALLVMGRTLLAPISVLPLPAGLKINNPTGQPLEAVSAQALGGPLVISNSPESLDKSHFESGSARMLCRALPGESRFRIFLHHRNITGSALQIGMAFTNMSGKRVDLYIGRNSSLLPERSASETAREEPIEGQKALINWFNSRTELNDISAGQGRYLHTLQPGENYYLPGMDRSNLEDGNTMTGMFDLEVRFSDGETTVPQILATVLACKAGRPGRKPDIMRLTFAGGGNAVSGSRATYRHDTRRIEVDCPLTDARRLDLAGSAVQPQLPGEYEGSIASPTALNVGNYGVVYDLRVKISNPRVRSVRVKCLLNAAGGNGAPVVAVNGMVKSSPDMLQPRESWIFHEFNLAPGESRLVPILYSLPGGTSGPNSLYFWPEER